MKELFKIILLLSIPAFTFSQDDLEKMNLLDNKIEILIPKSFHKMTEEEYKFKYPNPKRKASVILTDKYLEVNLVIDYLQQYSLTNEQVEEFKNAQLAAIQKSHPEGKLLDNGVKEVNEKKVGFFKIITQAIDQKIFNYFVFTNLDNKVLLLTFNCGEKLMPAWEKTIDQMVASLKVTK
jgi:hypothetical protein